MKQLLLLPPSGQSMPDGAQRFALILPLLGKCVAQFLPLLSECVALLLTDLPSKFIIDHALQCGHHCPVCKWPHLHTCHCTYRPPEVCYSCGLGGLHLSCCDCPHAGLTKHLKLQIPSSS